MQYDGDPEPMDSGVKTLHLVKRGDASDDDGEKDALVPSDAEATLSDENEKAAKVHTKYRYK